MTDNRGLDDDSPAAVRRAFVWLTAFSGVILLLPRQWVSAAICFGLAFVIGVVHAVLSKREEAGAGGARPSGRDGDGGPAEPGAKAVDRAVDEAPADDAALDPALARKVEEHDAEEDRQDALPGDPREGENDPEDHEREAGEVSSDAGGDADGSGVAGKG